jgi:hypothetical protein
MHDVPSPDVRAARRATTDERPELYQEGLIIPPIRLFAGARS